MRHKNIGRGLSRTSSHRKAMFRNMMVCILDKEWIKTTLPKAKELRRFLEPLITYAKKDRLDLTEAKQVAKHRLLFSRLRNYTIVKKLFNEIAPFYSKRPGGYLSILKCEFRKGDNAPMAIVRLVDRVNTDEVVLEKG